MTELGKRPWLVIGPGRLGCALAAALAHAGTAVRLLGRRAGDWQDFAAARGIETLVSEPQAALLGPETVCFFAVPDDALPELVRAWQQVLPAEVAAVAHGSGALGLELLAGFPAAMQLAIHPMRALPPRGTEAALQGAPLTLLASTATARAAAQQWVESVGARAIPFAESADRSRYHLACSLAANHLTGLLIRATELATAALGPEGAQAGVLALAESALDRLREHGAADALTGPLVRGDRGTLRAHLRGLNAEDAARYLSQLEELLEVAVSCGRLEPASAAALREEMRAFAREEGQA